MFLQVAHTAILDTNNSCRATDNKKTVYALLKYTIGNHYVRLDICIHSTVLLQCLYDILIVNKLELAVLQPGFTPALRTITGVGTPAIWICNNSL